MTTRLSIFNGALLECKEREIASLTENREPRRLLDRVWDNGGIDYCLGAAQWKFAKVSVEVAAEPSIVPGFGYSKAYPIPSDHLRTIAVASDPYFNSPLTQYSTERGYWFSDVEPLYISYVSNGVTAGGDMSRWPMEFVRYVEAYFASMIIGKLTQDSNEWSRIYQLVKARRTEAASGDAMEGPTTFPPMGAWQAARLGRSSGRRDRGSRSTLIG